MFTIMRLSHTSIMKVNICMVKLTGADYLNIVTFSMHGWILILLDTNGHHHEIFIVACMNKTLGQGHQR